MFSRATRLPQAQTRLAARVGFGCTLDELSVPRAALAWRHVGLDSWFSVLSPRRTRTGG